MWVDVKGYESEYQISDEGHVRSKYNDYTLKKGFTNNNGYLMIDLYKDGKRKKYLMHRLVAQTFIPNPENKPEIDHIDGNRQNNAVENLRWCTRKENCNNHITLKRRSESLTGRQLSEETKKKMSEVRKGEKNGFYGKHHTEEARKKIGNAHKGMMLSEVTKKKISESKKRILKEDE